MIVRFSLPAKRRARLLQERREAQKAADVFARVCEDGDAAKLCHAAQLLNECVDAWRPAMAKVARLSRVSPDVQNAFLDVWIESKTLPRRVGNRPVLAAALRVLFQCDIDVARKFAGEQAVPASKVTARDSANRTIEESCPALEGVILQTLAPPKAILLIRKPEKYYDEEEVIVDPFRLGKVKVIERLRG